MKRINKKIKWKYGVLAIVFSLAFVAPDVFQFVDFGTFNEQTQPKSWFDPRLSDFFYDDTIDETSYPFNAHNESYIMCKIQNIDFTNFTFNNTQYNVSYGLNVIPIDFPIANETYTITIEEYDANNDVYDWLCVQPLYILEEEFVADLDEITDNFTFDAGGPVSILVSLNFSYNWLYMEVDGTVINDIYDTDTYPEIDSGFLSAMQYDGSFIQFDFNLIPGEHTVKFKGNGTIFCVIASNADWDEDFLSDAEEMQKMLFDSDYDPVRPVSWGYFEKGGNFNDLVMYDQQTSLFRFYVPDNFSDKNTLTISVNHGTMFNISIDGNKDYFEGKNLTSGHSYYAASVGPGFHTISYEFSEYTYMFVEFFLNGKRISIEEMSKTSDIDADGMKDSQEEIAGTLKNCHDSDIDGLPDNLDKSPTEYLVLKNDQIGRIVTDHDSSKNTIFDFLIMKPTNTDYYSVSSVWKEGTSDALEVSVIPIMRLFGNSTISTIELEETWDKEVMSWIEMNQGDGDAIPLEDDPNEEVMFLMPEVAQDSYEYTFVYDIGHSAKSDSSIDIRFDFVWAVVNEKVNSSEIIHFYDFEDNIVIQSIIKREIKNCTYAIASPDNMIENQVIWSLIQNGNLGSFSDFDVDDDIVSNKSVDYLELQESIESDREADPISVDETGEINETEVVYYFIEFSSEDVLTDIVNSLTWTEVPEFLYYKGRFDVGFSFYSSNPISEVDFLSFEPESGIGDYKVCYTKSWENYSAGEGSFSKRMTIIDYPVYMNRLPDFTYGDVLEVSSTIGQAIPLNEFVYDVENIDYDHIFVNNKTTIELKTEDTDNYGMAYDEETDIQKLTSDNRIFDVETSQLFFGEYSVSLAWIFKEYLIRWKNWLKGFIFGQPGWEYSYFVNEDMMLNGRFVAGIADNMDPITFKPSFQFFWMQALEEYNQLHPEYGLDEFRVDPNKWPIAVDDFDTPIAKAYIQNLMEGNWFAKYRMLFNSIDIVSMFIHDDYWEGTQTGGDKYFPRSFAKQYKLQKLRVKIYLEIYEMMSEMKGMTAMYDRLVKIAEYRWTLNEIPDDYYSPEIRANPDFLMSAKLKDLSMIKNWQTFENSNLEPWQEEYYNSQVMAIKMEQEEFLSTTKPQLKESAARHTEMINGKNARMKAATRSLNVYQRTKVRWKEADFQNGLATLGKGIVFVGLGILSFVFGIIDIHEARMNYDPNKPLEFAARLALGTAKVLTGIILMTMGLYYFDNIDFYSIFDDAADAGLKGSGKFLMVMGFIVELLQYAWDLSHMDWTLPWEQNWPQFTYYTAKFIILGLIPEIIGLIWNSWYAIAAFMVFLSLWLVIEWIVALILYFPFYPMMIFHSGEDQTFFEFPEAEIKRHGSLRIGDTVNFSLTVENTGNVESYLYSNVSMAGESFSDYEGRWASGSGYEPSDPEEMLNFSRTLGTTASSTEFILGTKVAADMDDTRYDLYEGQTRRILEIPILSQNISSFSDDLTSHEKPDTYEGLTKFFEKIEETYEHNEEAETLDKLSNRIPYDFLLEDVGEPEPEDWEVTESATGELWDNCFSSILRPTSASGAWAGGTPKHNEIDEPILTGDTGDAVTWPVYDNLLYAGGHFAELTVGFEDIENFGATYRCFAYIVYLRITTTSWLGCDEIDIWFSKDGGDTWGGHFEIDKNDFPSTQNPVDWTGAWYGFMFTNFYETDISDFRIKVGAGMMPQPPVGARYIWLDTMYVEALYQRYPHDIEYTPEIVSDYKGHNKVMNVTCLGSDIGTEFNYTIGSSKTSGTIEFWLNKDNYSHVELENFFVINPQGSIFETDKETYIRDRPIELGEWNHFMVEFGSSTADLYLNGVKTGTTFDMEASSITEVSFIVFNDYEQLDPARANISVTYIDAVDCSWFEDYYPWRSFSYDYSLANITYYQDLRDAMTFTTSISTDLSENVVEMSTSTHIADFDFAFDLIGPNGLRDVDVDLYNLPDGFYFSATHFEQDLENTVSFDIEDDGDYEYSGIYYFEMNVTLDVGGDLVYHERVPFIIPYVRDLSFEQQNVIYENDDISNGNYTSENSFQDDTHGGNPAGWTRHEWGGLCTVNVMSELDGHKKVVQLFDTLSGTEYYASMYDTFSLRDNGTIEAWVRYDGVQENRYMSVYEDSSWDPGFQIVYAKDDGYLTDGDGNSFFEYENDKWYYVKFEFDCSSDSYSLWIDGTLYINNETIDAVDFTNGIGILKFATRGWGSDSDYYMYVDAVGYSWDSNYIIGENLYETDTIVDITESQVAKGDLVEVEFHTNTYAEVQMSFVNNDVVQETYTILPRGNQRFGTQSILFIVNESITFDEIRFTEFEYNYFDVLKILITDSLGSIGTWFNPVNITNDGNAPEYVQFGISGVDAEDIYATSNPEIVEQVDREFGDADWTTVNEAKSENNDWAESLIEGGVSSYVISVEHIELTLDGVTTNYATLSEDQVLANCVPFVSMKMDVSGDDWDDNMIDLRFESSPSKRIIGERGEDDGTVTLSIYIVEFDGVGVEVQSGTFSTAITYDNVDISAITQSKAFPMAYWKITGNDDDFDCAMVTTDFVDDDTIRMERDQGTGTISGHWYVVEAQNTEFSVQKAEMSMTTETSKSTSISSIDTSKSFVIGSWEANVGGDDVQYASLSIYLSSSTQVTVIRNAMYYFYSIPTINVFVVTFTGDESVQRGSFTFGNSDTFKSTGISAVTEANSMIKAGSMYGIMECDGTGNDDPEDSFIQYEFDGSSTVRGERMGSTGEDGVGYWEVIEWVVGGGGGGSSESDILRCSDFDFADSIPKDAVITGVVLEIDKHAGEATSIKDYSIRLRKPNGVNSSDKKSNDYWDTTDSYEIYGSYNDTWGLDLTIDDINNANFGVDIIVENKGATSVAYIDHVQVKIYYSNSFVVEILPGETIEMNFTIEQPSESENNLIYRGIVYQLLGSNRYRYTDNFDIDGIYIASPLNMTYNLIGNNLSCDEDEFSLEIIPEVVLSSMNYSLDGAAQVSFSGNSADVPLPETEGMHSIQVFGEGSGPTYYESEVRNFTIQYPIGILRPNETENTIFHEFIENYETFTSSGLNTEPDDWTVIDSDETEGELLYITEWYTNPWGSDSGDYSDTQVDNNNGVTLTSEWYDDRYWIVGEFYVNDTFYDPDNDREFLVSCDITSSNEFLIRLRGDEDTFRGTTWDVDDAYQKGIFSFYVWSWNLYSSFQIEFDYFEAVDITDEGSVEVVESMNGMSKPVQVSNHNWDSETSMERDFPESYETGNVTFMILRESITDKNTVLITLSGTSGTMVYTLEYNDLYNGTYGSKTELASNILKQDDWQIFTIFFNVSEGCQLFVDGVNTTMPGVYSPFSTGTPTDIDAFKIETVYHSGEDYSFWFDDFLVTEIEGGFMLDVYNRFAFLDDLEYSFDEGAKKSFDNRDLFSFPEDGLHNITIYGTDFYGNEYRSEFKIFTTGSSINHYKEVEYHEMPTQWSDYSISYGSPGGTGDTEDNDDDYAYLNAHEMQGGSYTGYSEPDSDIYNDGFVTAPLYSKIDDQVRYPATIGFSDSYIGGDDPDSCILGMTNVADIPYDAIITKVDFWAYCGHSDPVTYTWMSGWIRFAGYTDWDWSNLMGGYGWGWWLTSTGDISGEEYGKDEANALQVGFTIEEYMPDNTWWSIEAVYCKVYWDVPYKYGLSANVTFEVPSADLASIDTLYYDYATIGSPVQNYFQIWDYTDPGWDTLSINATTSYVTGSFDLPDKYISESNEIKIHFETILSDDDFDLRLDQLMILYKKYELKEL